MTKTKECDLEVDQDHGEEILKVYSHTKDVVDHCSRVYSFALRERRVGGVLKRAERKRMTFTCPSLHRDRNFF